jgi:hypothetical protein
MFLIRERLYASPVDILRGTQSRLCVPVFGDHYFVSGFNHFLIPNPPYVAANTVYITAEINRFKHNM